MLSPVDSTQEKLDDATTPRRATASEIRIECVQPDSEVAALLLNRYYDDLDRRFPDGFDVNRTVAATTAELRLPHGAFLAAFLGVDPVGCGAVRRLDDVTAEIKRMWIDPTTRGQGLGRRLLTALETAAR
jgi:GNAT superfamily N-acetyltransferase